MRLINADALRDRFQNLAYDDWNQGVNTTWANAYSESADIVDSAPTVEPEQRWIPVRMRPMDEEEKRYWEEHYAYTFGEDYDGIMFDCPMPEDGQEVWVCSKCGNVWQDTCEVDVGIGLEENGDWDDIVAWMPYERPEPWKGEEDGNN